MFQKVDTRIKQQGLIFLPHFAHPCTGFTELYGRSSGGNKKVFLWRNSVTPPQKIFYVICESKDLQGYGPTLLLNVPFCIYLFIFKFFILLLYIQNRLRVRLLRNAEENNNLCLFLESQKRSCIANNRFTHAGR